MSTFPFTFGIPGLDSLVQGDSESHIPDSLKNATWSAAIVGPDGCGKSILGLHLCSRYRDANVEDPGVAVLYVSTDLSFPQAHGQWQNFGLGFPKERQLLINLAYQGENQNTVKLHNSKLSLNPLQIGAEDSESQVFLEQLHCKQARSEKNNAVFFIDLQRDTAGDDWGFLNHFIGLLPSRAGKPSQHMLVVDAVEGLETFVGNTDGFGQRRSRRSRVAQLLRTGMRSGVHIVFVVEEPRKRARLPEQFVTDLVLRLSQNDEGDYQQRLIEVEKCRAFAHARGRHELSIRSGSGTFTGLHPHVDDPKVKWADDGQLLAHIHVTPSVHRVLKQIRGEPMQIRELNGKATFGATLRALDTLLN